MENNKCWQDCGEIGTLVVGMQNSITIVENSLVFLKRLNIRVSYYLGNPTPRYISKIIEVTQTGNFMLMFTAALFTYPKGVNDSSIHQQIQGSAKWDTYTQWSIIQPGKGMKF